jgi:hypothetical protein
MSELSYYESRTGKLSCTTDAAFDFITDLRNFGRFVREGTITDWQAEKDSCSFNVSVIGTVKVRLIDKVAWNRVVYQGDALSKNDFTINVDLSGDTLRPADIKLFLSASLNPMMKMMADKSIRQFMELLMQEIENFRDWNTLRE